eukprot:9371746-Alexandrium_andersonii.AAC.1
MPFDLRFITSGPAVHRRRCGRRHLRVTESSEWIQPLSKFWVLALCLSSGVASPELRCLRPDVP